MAALLRALRDAAPDVLSFLVLVPPLDEGPSGRDMRHAGTISEPIVTAPPVEALTDYRDCYGELHVQITAQQARDIRARGC